MVRSLAERQRAHEHQKVRLAGQEARRNDDERKARLIQADHRASGCARRSAAAGLDDPRQPQ
ncbi:MAG: hypothetical protein J2P48_08525 [Alphaproteobacteria bacterium]|nr:hypothetical protein [Alphaproteobacteria bacterium]